MHALLKERLDTLFAKVMDDVAKRYRRRLLGHKPHAKKATGSLADHMDKRVVITEDDAVGSLILPDHWRYVEDGRRKGAKQPPVSAIRKWIDQRRIKPWDGQTRKGLAYVMARSIAKKGIPPTHYLEMSAEEAVDKYRDRIERVGEGVVVEILENYFKETNWKS